MAQYPSVVVTDKGHDLISTANATNKAVTYIKAVVGDGQLNSQSIESLTAMISPKLELPLSMGVDLGDGQWRISFALSNSTLTNGFYAREVGIFAKLDGQDDSTAILFGYTNGGNYVDYIPPKTTPIDSQVFNCDFVIGDAENVTVNILDGAFVTHQDLNIHNTDSSAHEDILNAHNADVNAHTPILNAIKAISGMSAYDIAPSKTIDAIIPLLGFGGIVAQRLETNGYVKFANRFTIQWGNTSNSPTTEYASKATLPIVFLTPFMAVGSIFDSVGTASELNYDDAIKLTSTEIAFRHFGHSYIAIGLA